MVIQIVIAILATLGFFSLLVWLIQQVIASKAKERALEQENSKLNQENSAAKKEIAKLQEQISKYTDKNSILSNYEYIERIGVFKHKSSGVNYCHKCLIEKNTESPLKTTTDGWICPVCNTYYGNLDHHRTRQQENQEYHPFDNI